MNSGIPNGLISRVKVTDGRINMPVVSGGFFDNKNLCYHYLGDFDSAMVHLIESVKNIQETPVIEVWHNDGDQVLAYRRKKFDFCI